MPFRRIFKKASHFILRSQTEESSAPAYSDGEVVFCKNNVCVHPPTMIRQETDILHHPGYLTITCEVNDGRRTLFLTWIPNTTLRRHPATVEQRSLSVTRAQERSTLDGEIRRRSASSVASLDNSRRNSSGNYETECIGCFPETETNWAGHLRNLEKTRRASLSSNNSDNNSLTPTDSIKDENVSSKNVLDKCYVQECSTKLNKTCDLVDADTKVVASDFNAQEVVLIQKEEAYHVDGRVDNLENIMPVRNTDTTVPNTAINLRINDKNIDEIKDRCEGNVPKVDNSVEDRVDTSNTDSKNFNGKDKHKNNKNDTAQFSFPSSDGIIYIDSLLLQENPHLLNESNHKGSEQNKKFAVHRNFDNFKGEESRKLPLRSFDENLGPSWMSSPELLALQHNLTFPESVTASPVIRRTQKCCRKFCVDLSEMRSLRLFFSDAESTRGQLVVASRECQYKILHFHHSGLERLAEVLQQWHLLTAMPHCDNLPYRHFMVCRPAVNDGELHPEEGKVEMVTEADWLEMLNPVGQLEDDLALRKGIFLGGLEPSLRKVVWPFLLHCYSYQTTSIERERILDLRRQEYEQITNRRLSLEGAAKERFLRNIQCVVEKDVIRTDRGNPYYAGESNPHLETMKNILLNYAIYDAGLGYMQGMSDLLAPLLAEIRTEADAFWCFVGLMRRTIFVCTPTDSDMERNLSYLRELIREMVPEFYAHLQRHVDAMELLFCHRWILLCFKREFPEETALRMWEACWANYLTDYFNLFLCLAIVSAYADDVIAQDLRTDEMLLHFSSLAMFMDGDLILRKARGLLYKFRQRPVIPCTLAGLCRQCGPGMWDSGHVPTVVCRGTEYCTQNPCPYRGLSNNSNG